MRSFLNSLRQSNNPLPDSREENPSRAIKAAPKPADPTIHRRFRAIHRFSIAEIHSMVRLQTFLINLTHTLGTILTVSAALGLPLMTSTADAAAIIATNGLTVGGTTTTLNLKSSQTLT